MNKERTIHTLTIESSVLSCNFVNTVYAWRGVNLNEYLKSYDDVIAWCRKLSVLKAEEIDQLSQAALKAPAKAAKVLEEIKQVRQWMYELISGVAAREDQAIKLSLEKLSPWISKARSGQHISYKNNNFMAELRINPTDLLTPLWPVLVSLHELLTREDPGRIKECPKCGWVFLDETKNGKRRWCSPVECGAQDKMLRYNRRKRGEG